MKQDSAFTGPWLIEYVDEKSESGEIITRHITADYDKYSVKRILDILQEVHPEWKIKNIYKVEKLPWLD